MITVESPIDISYPPIDVQPLFSILDEKLIRLLRSLDVQDWEKPTIAKRWTVKDIAAHLLDGNFRTLSLLRDGHRIQPAPIINSYQDLLDYLNRLNADWVSAAKRFSPQLLIELLESSGDAFTRCMSSLNSFEHSIFPVAWAGESQSYNWFHVAREYSEKFIHQQQIRDALSSKIESGRLAISNELMTRDLFFPFIQTFMFGLPHTLRDIVQEENTIVEVMVESEIGGQWFIKFNSGKWMLMHQVTSSSSAICKISPTIAWKLFSKGIMPAEAQLHCKFSGNEALARKVLDMVSVMA